jgi:putative ABC transport system permease protein
MTSMLQALRALARRPLFTIATLLTMTAGIGVTTAVFSIVDRVLIRPLPFPDGDQLVSVYEASPSRREPTSLLAPARLADWNRLNHTFEAISGNYSESVTDTSGAEPERLEGRRVMPRFFDVFAMAPLAGRTLVEEEERFGGATAAVISEPFWTRRFGRSPGAIGQRLMIGGKGYTIVGVMPRAFTSGLERTALRTAISIDIWIPAQLSPQLLAIREARFLGGVGRMRRGVTLEQARSDLARVQRQLGEQYPKTDKDWGAMVLDLKEVRVGDYRRAVVLIAGAVALLLLIAVAHVAGLMLVQLRRRSVELAIRSAIGASHRQVVMVVMREIAVLAIAGGAGGALGAAWLTHAIAAAFTIPRIAEVTIDWRALLFAAAATVLAATAFGLVPTVYAMRRRLASLLSSGGRGVSGGRYRLQGGLVVAQIALSVVLAGAAGLLVRSYTALSHVPSGFDTANTLTFHVGAAWDEDRTRIGQLQERLVEELQQLPGVRAAGFTNFFPATGATLRYQVRVEGLAGPETDGNLTVGTRTVTPGYLKALQVPLVAGEWCPEVRTGPSAQRTAMVNARFVDVYASGQNLIGRNVIGAEDIGSWRIVGTLGNIIEDGPSAPAAPYVYICRPAGSWPDPEYVVRADGDPRVLMASIRQLVRSLDSARPVFGVRRVDEIIGASLDQARLNARFLTVFAAAALALAAVGLYGLLTLLIADRRRELGVRMALGASRGDLVRLVLAGAGRLIALGMAGGLILTFAASQVLQTLLFGVTAHDPRALAAGVLALAIVSALAIAIPARQAARIEPIEAIRGD